jgi:hypothetical protein
MPALGLTVSPAAVWLRTPSRRLQAPPTPSGARHARDGQAENGRVLVGSLGIKLLISGFLHMPCHVAYRPAVPPQVRTEGPPGAP